MKKNLFYMFTLLLLLSSYTIKAQQRFIVDVQNRSDDLFKVTLYPEKLSEQNKIYQFASTAPGAYQRMDIGRFITEFHAYDEQGNEIPSEHSSLNQWTISDPVKVKKIEYKAEDTWDAEVDSNRIYLMCGSDIEDSTVIINGQCVFGYFEGMQSAPIKVKVEYPHEWLAGTALPLKDDGYYYAESFDQIVDSPIMLGYMTKASTKISNTNIDIYTYSKTGLIKSTDMLNMLKNILQAEDKFMNGLPVDHYTFLFNFGDVSNGAWEHSYSSEYITKEEPLSPKFEESLKTTVAHEFFHILTPLNIHSELVDHFNYAQPVMSQHLWLYEGTTEWAANILLLRDKQISLTEYLNILKTKLNINDHYDQTIPLTTLGVRATDLQVQYGNIYNKGAIVSGLLDIKLLELSNGKKGLREVINELAKKYGPKKSFNEQTFFDDFVKLTYPQIKDFFDKYIKGTEPLPIKEYYDKIGINYLENGGPDSSHPTLGMNIGVKGKKLIVTSLNDGSVNTGVLYPGDIIEKIENSDVDLYNANQIFGKYVRGKNIGDTVKFTVLRNDKNVEVTCKFMPDTKRHIFTLNFAPNNKQLQLKRAWLNNL